ncbi:MAG: nucleotidyl transferase AbiEii/AbiGii toxin family protein [Rhodocyclaceae bacterium]|nr:nucleotidyl transferase AbiEii/AbiGii toxin family protein [Rhodocyclaceae bacterium]MCO5097247.1 nucleotidyl transferase AbiEii/AbiGii toxin family protein [Rhodocyclaceae bacterium]
MKDSPYFAQADLLLQILPLVAREPVFALKGGTAINLFVRDLPRLSVDIDLVYLPLKPRAEALAEIDAALARIADYARKMIAGARITRSPRPDAPKLVVQVDAAQVKIEPNAVLRGSVYPPETRSVTPTVEEAFGRFVAMPVVSLPDLYGGKLVAALDRQHPRDLFDVLLLLANEGIGDAMRQAFVVYLASHGRTMAEVLEPTRKPLSEIYEAQFAGMARIPVTVAELDAAREAMIRQISDTLTESERKFLLSVKLGEPDWNSLPIPHLAELPALQWKILNIRALAADDPQRHEKLTARLREVLKI